MQPCCLALHLPPRLQNYLVSHIDELQALVIVEHGSGQYNLYLSDLSGVYFTLSLPNIVFEANFGVDLELVSFMIQYCGPIKYSIGVTIHTVLCLSTGKHRAVVYVCLCVWKGYRIIKLYNKVTCLFVGSRGVAAIDRCHCR
jgi:hypothetical protein